MGFGISLQVASTLVVLSFFSAATIINLNALG